MASTLEATHDTGLLRTSITALLKDPHWFAKDINTAHLSESFGALYLYYLSVFLASNCISDHGGHPTTLCGVPLLRNQTLLTLLDGVLLTQMPEAQLAATQSPLRTPVTCGGPP